jgi:hypothetical protein
MAAGPTLELLRRIKTDVADIKREQLSMGPRLATIE